MKLTSDNFIASFIFNEKQAPSKLSLNNLDFVLTDKGSNPTYRSNTKDNSTQLYIRLHQIDSFNIGIWTQIVFQYSPNVKMDPIEEIVPIEQIKKMTNKMESLINDFLIKKHKFEFQRFLAKAEKFVYDEKVDQRLQKAGESCIKLAQTFIGEI